MYRGIVCFFFCNQKTAYELRISDFSSDVCSSDLSICAATRRSRSRGPTCRWTGAGPRLELIGRALALLLRRKNVTPDLFRGPTSLWRWPSGGVGCRNKSGMTAGWSLRRGRGRCEVAGVAVLFSGEEERGGGEE